MPKSNNITKVFRATKKTPKKDKKSKSVVYLRTTIPAVIIKQMPKLRVGKYLEWEMIDKNTLRVKIKELV